MPRLRLYAPCQFFELPLHGYSRNGKQGPEGPRLPRRATGPGVEDFRLVKWPGPVHHLRPAPYTGAHRGRPQPLRDNVFRQR